MASQLERRTVPLGGAFTFLTGLAVISAPPPTRLLLPPPRGLGWVLRRLKLPRTVYRKRSSFCYVILLLNEQALHVLLCRFLNTSEPLARFLRCQRPIVPLRWAS